VFIEAKDDGSGGDNWRSWRSSQITTTNKPTPSFFYRLDALPVAQPTVSKQDKNGRQFQFLWILSLNTKIGEGILKK